jgi:hypothetical protein
MTNNKLLDAILHSYLQNKQWELSSDPRLNIANFSFIAKAQLPDIENWRIDFLKETLLNDKLIEPAKYGDEEPFTLTADGIKGAQIGWYEQTESKRVDEKTIRDETIIGFKRAKESKIISIIAVIISFLLLVYTIYKDIHKQLEISELKQELKNIQTNFVNKKDTIYISENISKIEAKKGIHK